MSEKQIVSFLRLLTIFTSWRAREDRIINLRREILGQLGRERLQRGGLAGEILFPLLQLGDVGIDRDGAAVLRSSLAHHDPASVAAPLHLRLPRVAVPLEALRNPGFDPAFRILDLAALRRAPDDGLERRAGGEVHLAVRVEHFLVAGIADDEPVLGVVIGESLRDALDRLSEPTLALHARQLRAPQRGDVIDPAEPLSPGEADMPAVIGDLDVRDQQM
jgi:hypothetical protein